MLRSDYYHCIQGLRDEQLDRFVETETGRCTIVMLADGYSSCSENPHYVDWLTERVLSLKFSGLCRENAVQEITSLIAQTECYPGKASVAFVVSDEQQYQYSTLGDTRIYWPQQNIRTQDHSIAQLAVLRGECPPEQLRFHPYRNRLMRHAGSGLKHRLEWKTRPLSENECLILCSDGLWSQLDDHHIYSAADRKDLAKLLDQLFTVPPPDNLSVVILSSIPFA